MRRSTKRSAIWGIGVLLLVGMLMMLMVGCGEEETTTTAAPTETTAAPTETTAAPTETTAAPTETTAPAGQPVAGGTLRLIDNAMPQSVGYWPAMGPTEEGRIFPGVERLSVYTNDRTLEPDLAESIVEDPEALTMTIKLHEGVMFHDGTELTAEVAKWNFDLGIEGGKLQFADALESIEIVDKYTFVLHLKWWSNQLIQSFGWVPMFSQDAYEKNGGEEWALDNLVGTGPFMLEEFNRDQSLVWVKNPNYWREGLPYLDRIEVTFIPDIATAGTAMKAGEGDIWVGADAQAREDMEAAGFVAQSAWAGFIYHLMPNTMDPASPMNDLRVREAVEYALDKPAITDAIGYGWYEPLWEVAPAGEWGAGSSTVKREYDPEKAKALLAEAGFADGCPIDLLAVMETGGRNTAAEAVKGYLDAAGFVTTIDIADPGRFYGSVFGTGWKDLALMFSGTDVNYLVSIARWWSPTPMTNLASFKRPDDFAALCNEAIQAREEAAQIDYSGKIIAAMAEDALMIPFYLYPNAIVIPDYVHTDYPKAGFVAWDWGNTWMDPH